MILIRTLLKCSISQKEDKIKMNDEIERDIVDAIMELTEEVRALRELMESWDEVPPIDEKDTDKYIL